MSRNKNRFKFIIIFYILNLLIVLTSITSMYSTIFIKATKYKRENYKIVLYMRVLRLVFVDSRGGSPPGFLEICLKFKRRLPMFNFIQNPTMYQSYVFLANPNPSSRLGVEQSDNQPKPNLLELQQTIQGILLQTISSQSS